MYETCYGSKDLYYPLIACKMQTHHVTWLFLTIIGFGSIKVVVSIMLLLLYNLSFLLSIFHWIGVDLLCNLHHFKI